MYKTFDPARDIQSSISPINEVVVMGNLLFSQSSNNNIKRTVHWTSGSISGSYYDAVFSDNILSASSVELVDIAYGQSISSSYYLSASATNKTEKSKIYRLFAKRLLGAENQIFNLSGTNRNELIFISIRRSQFKDEIKKGATSFTFTFSGSDYASQAFNSSSITDNGAATKFTQNIAGDYADLVAGSATAGRLYYQAGIAVLIPEMASNTSSVATNVGNWWISSSSPAVSMDYNALAISGTYTQIIDSITRRIKNVSFVNQINLHSSIYFCRLLNDEFNYSSNPTFIDTTGRIIPTSSSVNLLTRTYPTKVGLLGENGELLAVASISKPILKSPTNEFTINVRLDY